VLAAAFVLAFGCLRGMSSFVCVQAQAADIGYLTAQGSAAGLQRLRSLRCRRRLRPCFVRPGGHESAYLCLCGGGGSITCDDNTGTVIWWTPGSSRTWCTRAARKQSISSCPASGWCRRERFALHRRGRLSHRRCGSACRRDACGRPPRRAIKRLPPSRSRIITY